MLSCQGEGWGGRSVGVVVSWQHRWDPCGGEKLLGSLFPCGGGYTKPTRDKTAQN